MSETKPTEDLYVLQLVATICKLEDEADRKDKVIEELMAALKPFTHPDLRLRLGDLAFQPAEQIVFYRSSAYLRLRDFDNAAEAHDRGRDE